MSLPFSSDQYFGVMASYNLAIWPAQAFLLLIAFAVLAAVLRNTPLRSRLVASLLALLWVWMAVAYHWMFFSEIHPLARVFASLFLVQGVLLLGFGLRADALRFAPRGDVFAFTGGFLVTYALVLYPVLATTMGRDYPSMATFGLPCPTTIFTIGVLLWAKPRTPGVLLLIPAIWAAICLRTMISFRTAEDVMLPLAVLLAGGLALLQSRSEVRTRERMLRAAVAGRSRPPRRR